MERRKRVEALMSSKLFREELERVLDQQMHEGNDAPLLQRIREMVGGRLHTGSLRVSACAYVREYARGGWSTSARGRRRISMKISLGKK